MNVLACYSIKGGVGKTALSVNLAYALAAGGRRTLLADLDPQGAAAYYFRVSPAAKFPADEDGLDAASLRGNIRESDYPGLDILPSNLAYRRFDLLLNQMKKSRKQLRRLLRELGADYDVIVLDCPPNITLLAENIFRAADFLLVPVIPTTLSRRTLDQLVAFFRAEDLPASRLVPFFSMVQAQKRLHHDTMTEMRAGGIAFLEATIPFAVDVENMGLTREPVLVTAPERPAAVAYATLCREIMERCARADDDAGD